MTRRTGLTLVPAMLAVIGCADPAPQPEAARFAVFGDRAAELGLAMTHDNGAIGERWIAEMMGGGAALLDIEHDGDLDVLVTAGGPLGPASESRGSGLRLFRNDGGRFAEVTEESGIPRAGYAMGLAVGDYDGDGRPDVYVTEFGPNRLLRNLGDGRFEDVTESSGVADSRWSVPAVFWDYDGDGRLDLYVGNYIDFRFANHRTCAAASGRRDYCGPHAWSPEPDRLFRNAGDGRFEDVSATTGIGRIAGNALGAMIVDVDADGRTELFVANDGMPNRLWSLHDDGTLVDRAMLAGLALNAEGRPEASMGVAWGDVDADGDEDLFLSHMREESDTLYIRRSKGAFDDRTSAWGLGASTLRWTGFGAGWLDVGLDGRLDLFVARGAVRVWEEQAAAGSALPLAEPDQLFRNERDRLVEVTGCLGGSSGTSVGRGAAFGDLDDDGDTDVVVVNNGGPLAAWINESPRAGDWIGLRLPDGTRAALVLADGTELWRRAERSGSYASANDPRVVFGVPAGARIEGLTLVWPGGSIERVPPPPRSRYTTLSYAGVKKGEELMPLPSRAR